MCTSRERGLGRARGIGEVLRISRNHLDIRRRSTVWVIFHLSFHSLCEVGFWFILLPPTFSTFDFLGPLTFVMSSFDLSAHSTVEDQLVQHLIVKFEKLTTEDQAPIVARNAARAIVALGVTDVQVRFQFLFPRLFYSECLLMCFTSQLCPLEDLLAIHVLQPDQILCFIGGDAGSYPHSRRRLADHDAPGDGDPKECAFVPHLGIALLIGTLLFFAAPVTEDSVKNWAYIVASRITRSGSYAGQQTGNSDSRRVVLRPDSLTESKFREHDVLTQLRQDPDAMEFMANIYRLFCASAFDEHAQFFDNQLSFLDTCDSLFYKKSTVRKRCPFRLEKFLSSLIDLNIRCSMTILRRSSGFYTPCSPLRVQTCCRPTTSATRTRCSKNLPAYRPLLSNNNTTTC